MYCKLWDRNVLRGVNLETSEMLLKLGLFFIMCLLKLRGSTRGYMSQYCFSCSLWSFMNRRYGHRHKSDCSTQLLGYCVSAENQSVRNNCVTALTVKLDFQPFIFYFSKTIFLIFKKLLAWEKSFSEFSNGRVKYVETNGQSKQVKKQPTKSFSQHTSQRAKQCWARTGRTTKILDFDSLGIVEQHFWGF